MKTSQWSALAAAVIVSVGACSTAPSSETDREIQSSEVQNAIKRFKAKDPTIARWFDNAYAYAVFPSVGKGAAGVGGAFGRGQVFEQGSFVGYAKMTQASLGLALGGQKYSEVVFFKDRYALNRFKSDTLELTAQASAIAVTSGASADADYSHGVAVFTLPLGGAMFEAVVAGQKFDYVPG